MRKVIFSKSSETVIHVDDIGNYSITGFKSKDGTLKGVLVLIDNSVIGVTLVKGEPDTDHTMPGRHPYINGGVQIPAFIRELQNEFDFFVFQSMAEFFDWIAG